MNTFGLAAAAPLAAAVMTAAAASVATGQETGRPNAPAAADPRAVAGAARPAAPPPAIVCSGQPVPKDWVVVDYLDHADCDDRTSTDTARAPANAWKITRAGSVDSLRVCHFDSLPEGWAVVRKEHDSAVCRPAGPRGANVYTLRPLPKPQEPAAKKTPAELAAERAEAAAARADLAAQRAEAAATRGGDRPPARGPRADRRDRSGR